MVDPDGALGAIRAAVPTVLCDLVEHLRAINENCMVRAVRKAHLPHGSRRSFFDRNGENHHRLRALVGCYFTSTKLDELRPKTERVTQEVLDALGIGGLIIGIVGGSQPMNVRTLRRGRRCPRRRDVQFTELRKKLAGLVQLLSHRQ